MVNRGVYKYYMNIQFELLPGSFRTEHNSYGNKTIFIDNYVVHLKYGFDTLISATKEYIKADKDDEARKTATKTTTEVMISKSQATEFIDNVVGVMKPVFDFYAERFKDVNITLFNIRIVSIHIVLDELMGEEKSWKSMLPYTRISQLTKYGIYLRNFIEDILHYMVKEYVGLKLDITGMDLYKISTHVSVHTNNEFKI